MKDFKGKGKPFHKKGNDFRKTGGDYKRGGSENAGFDRGANKEMHDAICAECGKKCQVPFKPNGRKPILCSSCFRNSDDRDFRGDDRRKDDYSNRSSSASSQYSVDEQLKRINQKLDQILRSL